MNEENKPTRSDEEIEAYIEALIDKALEKFVQSLDEMPDSGTDSPGADDGNAKVDRVESSSSATAVADYTSVEFPSKYNVIFHNDDVTPMGFVVELLVNVFSYNQQDAVKTMMLVHHKGKAVVGTYIRSIAEAKVSIVREVCNKAEYPLNVTIEKE